MDNSHLYMCRLSPGPFVFCVIYGYCMTFGETAKPDIFRDYSPPPPLLLKKACGIMNSCKFPIKVQVTDGYKDLEQV